MRSSAPPSSGSSLKLLVSAGLGLLVVGAFAWPHISWHVRAFQDPSLREIPVAVQPVPEAPAEDEEAREAAAKALYAQAQELIDDNKPAEARTVIERLEQDYGDTSMARRAGKLSSELAVIGKSAPRKSDFQDAINKWLANPQPVSLSRGTTVLVFWEVWCPHCKRELPELSKTHARLASRGLQVVGLTKITRSSTEEGVLAFISENDIGFPIAWEDGTLSTHFNVSGIPAAAVVRDGEIVWRGHPGKLDDALLGGWL